MQHLKQSLAWGGFVRGEMTGEQLIRVAADIGYTGIEMPPQEYWQQIKQHGLTIPSIAGHQSITEGLNRAENHARIEKELRANLALAEKWGIEYLIVFSGNRAGLNDNVGAAITADGLRRVAKIAEEAGITLVLELLNSKINHKDYQADHVAWGIQVCRAVHSPAVKLLYDIYHMQIMEGDIIRTIRTHHPYFAHYHTAGNPGRHEIDETQELNYTPIIREIAESGYSGYIGHEFKPAGDPIAALKHAFALCQQAI